MCGRFTLFATAQDLAEYFQVKVPESIEPRYNIAPSQSVAVVIQDDSRRSLESMQWGLIPGWVKDLESWKANLINARAETLTQKASFKSAFAHRPCLIPTTGFYEWSQDKQPFFFQAEEQPLFALAGLWEVWQGDNEELLTCTIITTQADAQVAPVHGRMPLIIHPDDYERWLSGSVGDRQELLGSSAEKSTSTGKMVSKQVNNPRHDQPDCIEAVE
jgi:putative SOS response-associated peptidase YedK